MDRLLKEFPPHEVVPATAQAKAPTAIKRTWCFRPMLPSSVKPTKLRPKVPVANRIRLPCRCTEPRETARMVSTELAAWFPGVMELGAKEQARLPGNPEHPRSTTLSKAPHCGVAVIVTLLDPPAGIVTAVGLAPNVRLPVGPGQVDVYFTAADI